MHRGNELSVSLLEDPWLVQKISDLLSVLKTAHKSGTYNVSYTKTPAVQQSACTSVSHLTLCGPCHLVVEGFTILGRQHLGPSWLPYQLQMATLVNFQEEQQQSW